MKRYVFESDPEGIWIICTGDRGLVFLKSVDPTIYKPEERFTLVEQEYEPEGGGK